MALDLAPDAFHFFDVKPLNKPMTRRGMLSELSSVFDPLGPEAPVLLLGRVLLQELLDEDLGWDEQVPKLSLDDGVPGCHHCRCSDVCMYIAASSKNYLVRLNVHNCMCSPMTARLNTGHVLTCVLLTRAATCRASWCLVSPESYRAKNKPFQTLGLCVYVLIFSCHTC